ncbi:MFS transporter [Nonomuraea longispora]|uniref:Lysosomal dipeptide transporter MFSD1 n=1 Tax=Nonomuraea longispora TaxID=1848320 RepID=A0A4R4NJV2_9ACTN|nr:MFS transporter [Nonomuraea longispora]
MESTLSDQCGHRAAPRGKAGAAAGHRSPPPPPRTGYAVWIAAVSVYVVAAFYRSALSAAGPAAVDRFDITATQLGGLVVGQLLVYAAMQIPVGMLVDRFGPRCLLVAGATVMTCAQLGFAVTGEYIGALVARMLVGTGDAMILISVLRLVTAWFPPRRSMVMVTTTAAVGGLGALAAAAPLSRSLLAFGWTATLLVSASFGVVVGVLALVVVRDTPRRSGKCAPDSLPTIIRDVQVTWRNPGTKLGFWSHFALLFPFNVFCLLWGYPYLIQSEHVARETAAVMVGLPTAVVVAGGPLIGAYVARHSRLRPTIVMAVLAGAALTWTAALLWPGDAPLALLGVLAVAVGICAPASMIGFDVVRTSVSGSQLGRATGIVNFGGFGASVLVVLAIGIVIDAGSASPPAETYRWAMCLQYPVWLLGGIQVWRYRHCPRQPPVDRPAGTTM